MLDSNSPLVFQKWLREAKTYESLRDYFEDIKHLTYVVMRNWDNLPDDAEVGEHSDLDMMVSPVDLAELYHITHPIHRSRQPWINQVVQPVGDSYVLIDVRTTYDNYLPSGLAENMLLESGHELYKDLIKIPNKTHYFDSLLYHGTYHKLKLGDDYVEKLAEIAPPSFDMAGVRNRDYVSVYFDHKGYRPVEPYDPYVYYIHREVNEKYPKRDAVRARA